MKGKMLKLPLLSLLLLSILLSGCRTEIPESDRLSALMTDVNAEHRAVSKPAINVDDDLERLAHDTSQYSLDIKPVGAMQNGVLTAAQAKNDTNYLMYQLQTRYGLYDYLGGDAVFNAARDRVFQACDERGTLTPDSFADLLINEFSFIADLHFYIGGKQPGLLVVPYQYREVAFEKDEDGYRIFGKNARVASVTGYDDLDALFRRSISDDGHLVYYPTVLQSAPVADSIAMLSGTSPDSANVAPPDLEVRLEDGTVRSLSAGTVSFGNDSERATVELYEDQSIPVLFSREMAFDEAGDADGQAFLDTAASLSDAPVAIVDLRSNVGGNEYLPYKWVEAYAGTRVMSNYFKLSYSFFIGSSSGSHFYVSDETHAKYLNVRPVGTRMMLAGDLPDEFVANDRLLIVLTGKSTASAAEVFVDLLHNVENVLFVGDLTAGCIINGGSDPFKLPCSLLSVRFGNGVKVFPAGYFQELRGFEPDLWVPAGLSEQLVIKLLANRQLEP